LGQRKYPDAERVLLTGYEGMRTQEKTIPANVRRARLCEALDRLVRLYKEQDKVNESDKWRKELEAALLPNRLWW
jgi:hypothetical protein